MTNGRLRGRSVDRRRARGLRPARRAATFPSSTCWSSPTCISRRALPMPAAAALLPPYDTAATLARLAGRSWRTMRRASSSASATAFTTARAPRACPIRSASGLMGLMAGRDWFWVAGNHDPDAPADLPGETVQELAVGGLVFRHEPSRRPCRGRGRRAPASVRPHRPARPLGAAALLCQRWRAAGHAGLRRLSPARSTCSTGPTAACSAAARRSPT